MENENISLRVQNIIADAENNYIEYVQGNKEIQPILFNQRAILRRINFYINNRYIGRDDDAIFWNISNHRITHFSKLISPDTKDFMPYGIGEMNMVQSWLLRKKVIKWFDDESFYQILNDLGEGIATYGSIVWKRYKDNGKEKIKEVKLDNLYFDQTIDNIKDADGIVELHRLNKKELLDKQEIWENIDEVIRTNDGKKGYEIWEYYGYDYSKDEPEYVHIIGSGYGDKYIKLWEEVANEDDCPYEDFHLGRYRGRWLRVGVVERLFKLQERVNQLVNQNAQATEIASLLLLKSGSPDMTGNVLEQAINGQIIPDETLQQIGITNTGLNQFIQELQLIEQHADKLCLTPEIIQGEASPSNTTFRGIAVVNAGAVTAFKNYRQNIFEKIADVLMKYIFPSVVKNWNKEDIIEVTEDEIDVEEYDKSLKRLMERETILGGTVITPDVEAGILNKIESDIKGTGRRITIPKNYFNFEWGFKMMPTDETVDKAAKNDTYFNALQMIASNPAFGNLPLFKQYLEDNGVSWWKLTPKQQEEIMSMAQGGVPQDIKQPDKLLAQAQITS
jgi:hypothetical protein